MLTEVLTFAEERGPLEGVLTVPEGTVELLVVFVPGSGPVSRDGIVAEHRIPGIKSPFESWAALLAREGYASFRYDKRAAAYRDCYLRGDLVCRGLADEYGDDLADAVHMLQTVGRPPRAPVVLLGHSLGGVAALAHAVSNPIVSGVACIAAPMENLPQMLSRQLREKLAPDQALSLVSVMQAALAGKETGPILGLPAAYWRDYSQNSLERLIALYRFDRPLLLVQGANDRLVPVSQFLELGRHLRNMSHVTMDVVPDADHFLMTSPPGDGGTHGRYNLTTVLRWLRTVAGAAGQNPGGKV